MLEQNTKAMQDQLGFRVEQANTMGESGCRVVFQDSDGGDRAVHPVAGEWPFQLWEHLRELYLLLGKKDAEIADLRARSGLGRKVEVLESGDLAIRGSGTEGAS